MHRFYGNLRRIRNFPDGRTTLSARQNAPIFLRKSMANLQLPNGPMCTGKRQTHIRNAPSSRTAVSGIGPYKTPANPYCLANFECRAFLPQILKRNDSQIRCTVTGGAHQSVRRVTRCVRSDYKIGSCLNRTRSTHQTRPSTLFFPIFSLAREKIGPPEACRKKRRSL